MSGGSYDYFASHDGTVFLERLAFYADQLREDIEFSIKKVNKRSADDDGLITLAQESACRNAMAEIASIRDAVHALTKRSDALRDLGHAVEWWRSGDSSARDVWEAAEAWEVR
jgi:hypothetical protein